jgi:hypothetical protein
MVGDGDMDAFARMEAAFDRNMRAFEHLDQTLETQARAFERQGRAFEHQGRGFERQARGFGVMIAVLRQLSERIDDQSDQIRANTEATWRMLDRFSNGGEQTA